MSSEGTPNLKGLAIVVFAFAILTMSGLGSYYATLSAQPKVVSGEGFTGGHFVENNMQMQQLTLVEIMDSDWNSTTAQPKFYVMGSHGLESSANIVVPVNTMIQLTIVAYDTPTDSSEDGQGVVSGVIGGSMVLINGTSASMDDMPGQWSQNVTSVPGSMLAHTFSIPDLGINVPVVGGDTQIVYLKFAKAGTYTWYCLPTCGFGASGADGAMSKAGWMMGQITIK